MFVDCNRRCQQGIEPTATDPAIWLTHNIVTYHIFADHLSEIGVSSMTIGADAPAQKHICVCRLQDGVSVDVDRPDRVTEAHVVHIPQRRKNVWMDKNWLHNRVGYIMRSESERCFLLGWPCSVACVSEWFETCVRPLWCRTRDNSTKKWLEETS